MELVLNALTGTVAWNFDASSSAGEVQVEEAGDDDVLGTDDDDFNA